MLRCTTGSSKLDETLGGGIETQAMTELIGEYEAGKTQLCLTLCVTAQQPREKGGLEGTVLFVDSEGTFSPDRIHSIAKLFTQRQGSLTERLEWVQRLQNVVSKLWQTASQRNVVFFASCRPNFSLRSKTPEPERGRYLRHLASAVTYVKRVKKNQAFFSAHLLKYPCIRSRKTEYTLNLGGENMDRITIPFNIVLGEEINRLKENYQKALKEPSRRGPLQRK